MEPFYVFYEQPGAVGAAVNVATSYWDQISPRCDYTLPVSPGSSNAEGCVFDKGDYYAQYSLNGLYPQLAQHIQAAQQSGLPGVWGRA